MPKRFILQAFIRNSATGGGWSDIGADDCDSILRVLKTALDAKGKITHIINVIVDSDE